MTRKDEFFEILRVLVSQPAAEPSLRESCAEDAVSPAAPAKRAEEKKGRRVRS